MVYDMPTTREALRKLVLSLASKVDKDVVSNVNVDAGKSSESVIGIPDYKNNMAIEIKVTYNSSATAGGKLYVYYSIDGENFDTDTEHFVDLPFAAGATKQQTFTFPAMSKYAKIVIVNNDGTYALTIDSVKVIFF